MSQRITESMLESLLARLNRITNNPAEPYIDGKAQIGNFHLYQAYGQTGVHRVCNASGGASTVVNLATKRECYDRLASFISGIEFAKGD